MAARSHVRAMLKQKLNWKRPLFYLLLPIFLVMVFLGFPLPVAPPPATKPAQEQTAVVKKKKKRVGLFMSEADRDGN
ncbi:hypothetical protein [Massilia agri]|uniref:Uncharacterized protein n=1 Tax=Massilia agri TaxID=1886785 RepID=A0ABT2AIG6_9BURK|nr:hypothetical protein [Massilia agri]MCS0596024.1 hypothetical protein [Massilia agri]